MEGSSDSAAKPSKAQSSNSSEVTRFMWGEFIAGTRLKSENVAKATKAARERRTPRRFALSSAHLNSRPRRAGLPNDHAVLTPVVKEAKGLNLFIAWTRENMRRRDDGRGERNLSCGRC